MGINISFFLLLFIYGDIDQNFFDNVLSSLRAQEKCKQNQTVPSNIPNKALEIDQTSYQHSLRSRCKHVSSSSRLVGIELRNYNCPYEIKNKFI